MNGEKIKEEKIHSMELINEQIETEKQEILHYFNTIDWKK